LNDLNGAFDGVVIVAVDAIISSVVTNRRSWASTACSACLGLDGVFRVRRTGDAVFSGDAIDYAPRWRAMGAGGHGRSGDDQ
jgi:two-component system NtrC family sensor kinase